MFKYLKSNTGFSLPEILMGAAVSGIVAIGAVKLVGNIEQSKYQMKSHADYMGAEKQIESFLLSPKGCKVLEGKSIPSDLSFQPAIGSNAPVSYATGAKIGDVEIKGLKLKEFKSLSQDGIAGVAHIELLLLKKNATRGLRKIIPVAVNVEGGVIKHCNYTQTKEFRDLSNTICPETYGLEEEEPRMTCLQVIVKLRNDSVRKVCEDLYGTKVPKYTESMDEGEQVYHCDLTKIHSGESCSPGYVKGIDVNGRVTCASPRYPGTNLVADVPVSIMTGGTGGASGGTTTGGATTGATTGGSSLCSTEVKEWQVQGKRCSANVPERNDGETALATDTTGPETGSASFVCNNGTWSNPSATSCETIQVCNIHYQLRIRRMKRSSRPLAADNQWARVKGDHDSDCSGRTPCGFKVGVRCQGNTRVQISYSFMSFNTWSPEQTVTSGTNGVLQWGEWASVIQSRGMKECKLGCGLKINAQHLSGGTCTVSYRYHNQRDMTPLRSNGDPSTMISNTGDDNCERRNGCGIQAQLECTP